MVVLKDESTTYSLFYLCPKLWSALSRINPAWFGIYPTMHLGQSNDERDTLYLEVRRNNIRVQTKDIRQFGINNKKVLITISFNL
jgi:hypothetical protein